MWNVVPGSRWDWSALKDKVAEFGVRNSLLIAPMPTASTSQILGNNECFEPYTSNLYTRRVLSGEFIVVNKRLLKDLIRLGLWNEALKNKIIAENGSVQDIEEILRTSRNFIRQPGKLNKNTDRFSCRSWGFYLSIAFLKSFYAKSYVRQIDFYAFYGWKRGLKTGMYYLRTKAATDAIKFTIEAKPMVSCDLSNKEECLICSS